MVFGSACRHIVAAARLRSRKSSLQAASPIVDKTELPFTGNILPARVARRRAEAKDEGNLSEQSAVFPDLRHMGRDPED